jgi:hypothetical protein
MSQPPPEVKMSKNRDFRIISATGVFGGVNPVEGQMIFYADRLEPKSDRLGKLSLDYINRESQVEVHVPLAVFKSIAEWMMNHIKEYEQREKQQIKSVELDREQKQVYT